MMKMYEMAKLFYLPNSMANFPFQWMNSTSQLKSKDDFCYCDDRNSLVNKQSLCFPMNFAAKQNTYVSQQLSKRRLSYEVTMFYIRFSVITVSNTVERR